MARCPLLLLALCLAALCAAAPRAVASPSGSSPSSRAQFRHASAMQISEGTLNLPFTARTAAEGEEEGDGDEVFSVKRSRRGLGALPLLWSTLVVEVLPTRTAGAGCALQALTDELVPRRARAAAGAGKGAAQPLRLELSPVGADVALRVRCAPRAPNPLQRLLANGGLAAPQQQPAKGGPASAAFQISAFHQRRSSHPAALVAGVALLLAAPELATSAAAFYGGAMAAAATTLALLACVALARAAPGGRAKRALGGASALAALLMPSLTGLRDALAASYVRAAVWPIQYTARALFGASSAYPGDAVEALRPALLAAAVALCVLSAGAGFFVARRFLIDSATGAVLPGPSLFVLWLLRCAAAGALLHATSDGPASGVVAALALAATGGAARGAQRAAHRVGASARAAAAGAARVAALPVRAALAAARVGARTAGALLARRAAADAGAAAAAEAERAAPVPRTPTPPGSSAATPASRATGSAAMGLGSMLRRRASAAALSGGTGAIGPLPASMDPEPEVAAAAMDAAARRRRPMVSPAAAEAVSRAATQAALGELASSPLFGQWLVRQAGAGRLSLTPGAAGRAASPSAGEEWEETSGDDGDDAGDTSADTRGAGRTRKRGQAARAHPRGRRG